MDAANMTLIAIVLVMALILLGVPISFAMLISGIVGIVGAWGFPTLEYALGNFPVARVTLYALTVVPLFVLMGQWAAVSGIASDAYQIAHKWLSRFRGSLVLVTIGSCGLFAATTGSTVAEVAAMAPVAIPEMKKYKYDIRLATGSVAAAGTLGSLIPPSLGMVFYGIMTEESIGQLFIAGVIPGILSILIYMTMVTIRCRIDPRLAPTPDFSITWRDRFTSLVNGWGIVLVFVVVVGGLYSGIATPTEVGALGCVITLLLVLLAIRRGRSSWAKLASALRDTVKISGMVFALLIGSGIFALFMTRSGAIPTLVETVTGIALPPLGTVALVCLAYIPLGMFFEPATLNIVTVPIVYPIVTALGFNGIWFGIIFIKMMEIAVITPPVGFNLFVIKAVFPEISLMDVIRGTGWFLVMDVLTLTILLLFPQIALWLPSKMWN
ncbi:MAG: TRAP transporter large permease [Chloroflexota bacterium]